MSASHRWIRAKATSVSLGYQDMLMSVAWSAMGWTGHKAHAAEVRVHNLPQLTISSSSGDFRVSKQNSVVSIRGGLDRSYRLYNAAYNSGGYEIEACNVSNGDCGNGAWTRIHKSARAAAPTAASTSTTPCPSRPTSTGSGSTWTSATTARSRTASGPHQSK